LVKAPSRGNAKVVEALEDVQFLYDAQSRVFGHRYRRGEARGGRASVLNIVADFHKLTVSQLVNFEKNKGRRRTSKKT
jgi:hypothetical protein